MINRISSFVRIKTNSFTKKMELMIPKQKLKRSVSKSEEFELERESRVAVAIFCGKGEFYEAVACLSSFYHFSEIKFPLYWFDDDSLTEFEIDFLKKKFKGCQILRAKDCETEVTSWLEKRRLNSLLELRRKLIFGKRLTNIIYKLSGKLVLQLDSDILFLKKPNFIIDKMTKYHSGVGDSEWYFNVDIRESYCAPHENIKSIINREIIPYFNAGLVLFKPELAQLTFLEEVNSRGLIVNDIYYWEQTLFAILATVHDAIPLSNEYEVHFKNLPRDSPDVLNVVSRHYCSDSRLFFYSHFQEVLKNKLQRKLL